MKKYWKLYLKQLQSRYRGMAAAVLAAACTAVSVSPASVVLAEEPDAAMGRYVESEIALPEQISTVDGMALSDDGGLLVMGDGADGFGLWETGDDGETWELGWSAEAFDGKYFLSAALRPDGSGAGLVMEADADGGSDYSTTLILFGTDGSAKTVPESGFQSGNLFFSAQGDLICYDYMGKICRLDASSGEVLTEYAADATEMAGTSQDTLLALTKSGLSLYDLESGEPLDTDTALNDALYSGGKSWDITTGGVFPIVTAEDGQGRFYYVTSEGIYTSSIGGSMVEQIADGGLNSLSNPSTGLRGLAVSDGTFYVLYQNSSAAAPGILKYEYSADTPTVPAEELTVYSLTENSGIRQLIALYQKDHPDLFIHYETGLDGTDGVTVSDALRTLNTEILAGNGPDILILDGMSVETYTAQGLLTDLSGILEEVAQEDGLIDAIAYTYQEEQNVWAVPVRFAIPVFAGSKEALSEAETLDGLIGLSEQPDVLGASGTALIESSLYQICAGAWKNEDGTLDQEKLAEYVHAVRQIYDNQTGFMSEEYQGYMRQWLEGYGTDAQAFYAPVSVMEHYLGTAKIVCGLLESMTEYAGISSDNRETGDCSVVLPKGQQENVFVPLCTMGILSTSQKQDSARSFVTYVLSQEGETANHGDGFPVNAAALHEVLYTNPWEDGIGFTMGYDDNVSLDYTWPTEEEIKWLEESIAQLSQRAETGEVQRETVMKQVVSCLNKEISEEEAVNAIMQSLNLYLAE